MANGKSKTAVVQSSGNVFADLGLQNADEKQTKVRLAVAINQILQGRRVSQVAAAGLLKISQPKISALAMHFLNALDCDVEIVIRRKTRSRKAARILVTAA